MMYQDVWLNGKLVQAGYRSCEPRYHIVRDFCRERLGDGFTVCDIGANMAYFSIRLIEDFHATAIAFEFHEYPKRWAIIKKQKTARLMYVNRKVSLNDLGVLAHSTKFDLILALSVLHHVPGEVEQWILAMRKLARFTIVEMALSDSVRTIGKYGYVVPSGGEIIGYGESHLEDDFKRPIIAFRNMEIGTDGCISQ